MIKKKWIFGGLIAVCCTACDDFIEEDISDNRVNILAPKDKVMLDSNQLTLVWEELEGAESYHVVVVSPSFDDIVYYACDSVTEDYKLNVSLPNGIYEWSVQAVNSAYTSLKSCDKFQIVGDEK